MGFFSLKKNKAVENSGAKEPRKIIVREETAEKAKTDDFFKLPQMIISPRVTEKASYLAHNGTYVFNVSNAANKENVSKKIRALYKVDPKMVRIIKIRGKSVFMKGQKGMSKSGKKAYVTLKEGDKIESL